MTYEMKFASSSQPGVEYTVKVIEEQEQWVVWCNCPAGLWAKGCKHKRAFLEDEPGCKPTAGSARVFQQARAAVRGSDLGARLSASIKRIGEWEAEIRGLKRLIRQEADTIWMQVRGPSWTPGCMDPP